VPQLRSRIPTGRRASSATDMFSDGKVDAGDGRPRVNSGRGRPEWDLSYGSLVTVI